MFYIEPFMFQSRNVCVIGESWVSDGTWLLMKSVIQNVALFANERLAGAFLPDCEIQMQPDTYVAHVTATPLEVKYRYTPFFCHDDFDNNRMRLFLGDAGIVMVDEIQVERFHLREVFNGGRVDAPLAAWDGKLFVMPCCVPRGVQHDLSEITLLPYAHRPLSEVEKELREAQKAAMAGGA